ncbi:PilN domain-containing protein [Romboutsia sp.]|uniref:PilN domain-containing protein n=1 Tax=Romboutsia sp. TaxID=1965302 RepID=UPI002C0B83DF|nr:PilN domain-containing protein [Romboutsia sp.]HSQ88644.1 PilN domain-containing protein [Romboutsia sp.]
MTKLYISYYGDSISIVEGSYKKKNFIINDVFLMSSSDIEPDYSDKYNLLKHALKLKQYKTNKAVLCLNTLDVIVKSNKIPKINPKDLHSIMSMEIDEMISLDRQNYIFSYEVMREVEEHGNKFLDLILAGLESKEITNILKIFNELNLKLEYIDILPAAYSRVLKEIEYSDMMIVNTGEYSTAIDIYKEDSLYIHDNVPARLNGSSQVHDYIRLVDEANGLMNYYSSRNFGKIVDSILLIGKHANNKDIIESFKSVFTSEIIPGIESLYDIYADIKGNVSESQLNMIVEIIGCMLREEKKSTYLRMNLLPEEMKRNDQRKESLIKLLKIVPIVLAILYSPIIALSTMNDMNQNELNVVQTQIEQVKIEYNQTDDIEKNIKSKEDEVKTYDMLINKEPKWGTIFTAIDKNIPFKVQLDNLSLSYVADLIEDSEENQDKDTQSENTTTQNEEQPLYEKVPNFITITGKAQTPSFVGQFVHNLKSLPYFDDIKFSGVTEQTSGNKESINNSYSFSITAKIKDGVVISE